MASGNVRSWHVRALLPVNENRPSQENSTAPPGLIRLRNCWKTVIRVSGDWVRLSGATLGPYGFAGQKIVHSCKFICNILSAPHKLTLAHSQSPTSSQVIPQLQNLPPRLTWRFAAESWRTKKKYNNMEKGKKTIFFSIATDIPC